MCARLGSPRGEGSQDARQGSRSPHTSPVYVHSFATGFAREDQSIVPRNHGATPRQRQSSGSPALFTPRAKKLQFPIAFMLRAAAAVMFLNQCMKGQERYALRHSLLPPFLHKELTDQQIWCVVVHVFRLSSNSNMHCSIKNSLPILAPVGHEITDIPAHSFISAWQSIGEGADDGAEKEGKIKQEAHFFGEEGEKRAKGR